MRDEIVCYIINLVTNSRIEFTLIPDEVSDSVSSQFEETTPMGRSGPIYGYSATGPHSVSFSIQLHDDYCKGGILNTVNKLKALTYPVYNSGNINPPKCLIRIGNIINMTAKCSEVSVTWQKPYRNGQYIMAEVSLSFDEVTSRSMSAYDVEKGYVASTS